MCIYFNNFTASHTFVNTYIMSRGTGPWKWRQSLQHKRRRTENLQTKTCIHLRFSCISPITLIEIVSENWNVGILVSSLSRLLRPRLHLSRPPVVHSRHTITAPSLVDKNIFMASPLKYLEKIMEKCVASNKSTPFGAGTTSTKKKNKTKRSHQSSDACDDNKFWVRIKMSFLERGMCVCVRV